MSYKFRIEGKKTPVRSNSKLSLSDAIKKLKGVTGGVVLEGFSNNLVAFWCDYDNKVKIGFGARKFEINLIHSKYL